MLFCCLLLFVLCYYFFAIRNAFEYRNAGYVCVCVECVVCFIYLFINLCYLFFFTFVWFAARCLTLFVVILLGVFKLKLYLFLARTKRTQKKVFLVICTISSFINCLKGAIGVRETQFGIFSSDIPVNFSRQRTKRKCQQNVSHRKCQ